KERYTALERPTQRSADQVENEVELGACWVVVLELHRAAHVPIGAGSARDSDRGVSGIGERPLNRDLAVLQERCPIALPGLSDHDAAAVALMGANFASVRAVEDVVCEREDVAR